MGACWDGRFVKGERDVKKAWAQVVAAGEGIADKGISGPGMVVPYASMTVECDKYGDEVTQDAWDWAIADSETDSKHDRARAVKVVYPGDEFTFAGWFFYGWVDEG